MQPILTYGVNIVAIILVIVSMYFNAKRYNNIFSLPTSVINKKVKADNLKKLSNNRYVFYILGALCLLNLFFPDGLLKFVIPGISIVIITNILLSLFEEIDYFNVTAGEVSAIQDFKEKRREDVMNRSKAREEQSQKDK